MLPSGIVGYSREDQVWPLAPFLPRVSGDQNALSTNPASLQPSQGVRDSGALLCVHVLRDGGIGDGLGGRLKAALAAEAAAVAAETVQLPPRGVVGRDAPSLGIERVIVVDVIIVSASVDEVFPGSRSGTSQGGESQGSQEGEETKEEQALNAIIADASEGVQVVLVQPSAIQHGGQLVQAGLRVV